MKSFQEFTETQLEESMSVQSSHDFDSMDHWKIHKDYVIWTKQQRELDNWQGDIGDALYNYRELLKKIPEKIKFLEKLQLQWEIADEKADLMG